MISYIFIPKSWHQGDVSFFEAFLVDNILPERKINIGYIIFQHMKVCSLSEDFVFPYGMFITKIVKFFTVNLHQESDGKKLKSFDTYNRAWMRCMQFVRKKDGLRERESSMDPTEVDVSSTETSLEENDDNRNINGGGTQNEITIELQKGNMIRAKVIVDDPTHTVMKEFELSNNLNAQINSIGTCD